MLDVHAPHERMESIRDFLLHLLTITIGLLIALSLEGIVEWRHHVHLVAEARKTLRSEMEHNREDLRKAVPVLKRERAEMDENLSYIGRVQSSSHSKEAQHGSLQTDFQITDLRETAWKTAQASGALGYMPYDEAQRYAGVYEKQQSFLTSQIAVLGDYSKFVGLLYKSNMGGDAPITAEQANDFASHLGEWKAHLQLADIYARQSEAYMDAMLLGKPEPGGFHEDLQ